MKKFLAQQQRLENDSGPVHVCVCVSLLVSACVYMLVCVSVHVSVRECACAKNVRARGLRFPGMEAVQLKFDGPI